MLASRRWGSGAARPPSHLTLPHERRVFTDSDCTPGSDVALDSEQSHYLKSVLRLAPGSHVALVHRPTATEFDAVVAEQGERVVLGVVAKRDVCVRRARTRCLMVALLKGDSNDAICESATALGVDEIVFWAAERSIPRLREAADWEKKQQRWRRLAEAGARQAGLPAVPRIHAAVALTPALEILGTICEAQDTRFVCSTAPTAPQFRDIGTISGRVIQCIGPEGDFTAAELDLMQRAAFRAVSLGPFRLRSELAAVCAVSMANAVWGYHEL